LRAGPAFTGRGVGDDDGRRRLIFDRRSGPALAGRAGFDRRALAFGAGFEARARTISMNRLRAASCAGDGAFFLGDEGLGFGVALRGFFFTVPGFYGQAVKTSRAISMLAILQSLALEYSD